ncbi:MAG: hypothetical protein COB14_07515 [Alphaproteobacteria bacterium]|nr:MAG: hypothetical protein COB14_07515 [Alphaproteobacteria bacterium]
MSKKKQRKTQEIEAYAAFDGRSNILYATIKSSKEASADTLRKFNPPVEGYSYAFKVLPIRISVDLNAQHEIDFEE